MSEVKQALTEQQIKQRNRMVLLFIVATPVVIIILSTVMYYMADSRTIDMGTVNRGDLINPPIAVPALHLQSGEASPFVAKGKDGTPLWTFLILAGDRCDEACKQLVYLTRQTHKALPKQFKKIQRVILVNADFDSNTRNALIREDSDLHWVTGSPARLVEALEKSGVDRSDNDFYLVDPQGWLMMRYHARALDGDTINALGKDVIKDVKRLIP